MEKFFTEYYKAVLSAVDSGEIKLEDIVLECRFCPLRKACEDMAESGDNRPCAQFIYDTTGRS